MNMQFLMKQAQKIQQDITKAQNELAAKVYEGTAGGGAVCVHSNGAHEVTKISIDPELLKEDVADLEAMILVALNDVTSKIIAEREAIMQPITGGAKIPGIM